MGKALALAVGGLVTAIFSRLAGEELKSWMPWFSKRLLQIAIERLPEAQRERFSEEWASHISDVPGDIGKLVTAVGCVWAAQEITSMLTYKTPLPVRMLKRLLDVSVAAIMLIGAAPTFVLIILLLKLEHGTKESILDRMMVPGANGKRFTQYRFRVGTIRMDDSSAIRSIEISGLGELLHQSKLNNLPMLFNVLRGDMVLVGPALEDRLFFEVAGGINLRVVRVTGRHGTFVRKNISFWRIVWGRLLSIVKLGTDHTSN